MGVAVIVFSACCAAVEYFLRSIGFRITGIKCSSLKSFIFIDILTLKAVFSVKEQKLK